MVLIVAQAELGGVVLNSLMTVGTSEYPNLSVFLLVGGVCSSICCPTPIAQYGECERVFFFPG